MEKLELKWVRPTSLEYPKIWHTFEAKDVDSDQLVEFRIQDLPESRTDDAIAMMIEYFCGEEPLCEAYGVLIDPQAIEDFALIWRVLIRQKMALACFKEGSDEIVGLNINFVTCKDEHFMEELYRECKADINKLAFDVVFLLYENFDPCTHYNVDNYLSSIGLAVSSKYRGRRIGDHFLQIRREICEQIGIKLTTTMFSSEFSNRNADRAGFKLDRMLRCDDIRTNHPEFKLPLAIRTDAITVKSIAY